MNTFVNVYLNIFNLRIYFSESNERFIKLTLFSKKRLDLKIDRKRNKTLNKELLGVNFLHFI